jgi:hypothetical protein
MATPSDSAADQTAAAGTSRCSPDAIGHQLRAWQKQNPKLSDKEAAAKLRAQGCTGDDISAYNRAKSARHAQPRQRYQLAKFDSNLLNVDRKVCNERTSPFSYLVLPAAEGQEGLFPVGEISMFAGASGAWKTSVILLFIKKWTQREKFFGRSTCNGNGNYLIFAFDRSANGFARTAVRMGYDPNDFNLIDLGADEYSDRDPSAIINAALSQPEYRDVEFVLVEGIDLKVGDVDEIKGGKIQGKVKGGLTDAHAITRLARSLMLQARQRRFSLIVSVGSPKQRAGNQYTSKRDQIIGSSAWGRMVETIVFLSQQDESDSSRRVMSIMPRNGKDEEIPIALDQQNRPTEAPQQAPRDKRPPWQQVDDWVKSEKSGIKPGDAFTPKQVCVALPHLCPNMTRTLDAMVKYGNIERLEHGKYRRKPEYKGPFEGQI